MAERLIFLVDMESFYASVEVAERPELAGRPVVVAGDPERRHGIVLAASPEAKRCGVQTAMVLFEAERLCPALVVVRPRMRRYLEVSLAITAILYRYSDLVEPYSIDEQFLDMTGTVHLFGTPEAAARRIQADIRRETGVRARVGIGPTKVLAKMACDVAKKRPDGLFRTRGDDLAAWLYPQPVDALFGVGTRMRAHLERMGIRTVGHLAAFPRETLRRRFGLVGERLWRFAHGIDPSPVVPPGSDGAGLPKSIGHGLTLPFDYRRGREIEIVLLELTDEVLRRLRQARALARTVSVGARGADFGRPEGFFRTTTLPAATDAPEDVYGAVRMLFRRHWDGAPVRQLFVSVSGLVPDEERQLSLFSDRLKGRRLAAALDRLAERYGRAAVVRAVSLLPAAQARSRAVKIGGHAAE
ncbi:MAG: DNA polymerase IV [Hydrogenibacillus schlegelii]|nr:DNA polymerase IV [Hydrogenibacillus schlegelii]